MVFYVILVFGKRFLECLFKGIVIFFRCVILLEKVKLYWGIIIIIIININFLI